jgi:hypothetical protein
MTWTTPREIISKQTSFGGDWSIKSSTTGSNSDLYSPIQTQGLKEYYLKYAQQVNETASDAYFRMRDAAGTQMLEVRALNQGVVVVEDSSGSVEITTTFTPNVGQWYVYELHVIHDGTSGIIELLVDGVSQGSTAVKAIAVGDGNGVKQIMLQGLDTVFWDDIGVNSITMRYDGGTGSAPAVGEVLTGTTSGAFATVTALLDGNATAGTVLLHLWDGTAFLNNEAVTGDVAAVAVIDAPTGYTNGFEPNSGYLGNSVCVRRVPTGDGNTSGLTNSAGNSVNNWSYVDDTGGADYVRATAADQRDTYALSVATGLPTGTTIGFLSVQALAESQLTGIDGLKTVVRYSGTDYDSARTTLTGSYANYTTLYNVRPDDDETTWDATSAAAIEIGPLFVA